MYEMHQQTQLFYTKQVASEVLEELESRDHVDRFLLLAWPLRVEGWPALRCSSQFDLLRTPRRDVP